MTLIEMERCENCPLRKHVGDSTDSECSKESNIFCTAFENWDELNPERIPHEVLLDGRVFVTCPVELVGYNGLSDEACKKIKASGRVELKNGGSTNDN